MKKSVILSFAAMLAANSFTVADAEAGAESKCKACHNFTSAHKMGPGLAGVFGRSAGSTDFAGYSDSLKNGGWVWNEENLRIFLTDTKAGIKTLSGDDNAKTKMTMKVKEDNLDEVIAFLEGLK